MNSAFKVLVMILCTHGESLNSHAAQNVRVFSQLEIIEEAKDDKLHAVNDEIDFSENIHFRPKLSQEQKATGETEVDMNFIVEEDFKKSDLFSAVAEVKVTVDTSRVANCVEDYFLSFAIDSSILEPDIHWMKFNFSSPKIYTLLTALSPALLRIGGSPADYLFFDKPQSVFRTLGLQPPPVVMTKSDISNLVGLTKTTGNRLLFDLNLQLRFGSQWDPSNAIELLQFCSEMGFGDNMDWELGNEPDADSGAGQVLLTPKQIGNDFVRLKSLLKSYPAMANAKIVGPDVVGSSAGALGLKIIEGVANASGSFLKAITVHHYYFRGDVATVNDYMNPENFDNLAQCIQTVRDTIHHTKYPNLPIWLGETSDAWHEGTVNVSDRFVSGFLWMDKLGLSAQMGVTVVVRQTLYGHYYSLLDINMDPNPDYWLSWLHHLLVGERVLSLLLQGSVDGSASTTRVYAQCTNAKSGAMYNPGAVTVFGLNVNRDSAVALSFAGRLAAEVIDVYLMEPYGPDGILSKWVKVNGRQLLMLSDTKMPELTPSKQPPGSKVLLPPLTFGFFVFPEANVDICK